MSHDDAAMALLGEAARHACAFLDGLPDRPVGALADVATLRRTLGGPLPARPSDPSRIIDQFVNAADPGIVASAGPRFFGFVTGGSLPAALAADWIVSAWDQNAGLAACSPAVAVIEEVVSRWFAELLTLPDAISTGFVTGATMGNFTALAAARHDVLRRAGWDVEARGLHGAPPITVVAGEERHATIDRVLRLLGLGTDAIRVVAADDQGRMRPDALAEVVAGIDGPLIVCGQAGNVNTGAFDPLGEICEVTHAAGGWVHVDGAFGLWAAASTRLRHLVSGIEGADSWATDAHKWLNVPYDCGLVFCAHPDAHRAAIGATAAGYLPSTDSVRDPIEWNPEMSRRARAVPAYVALRSLGREGVAELVERCCDLAAEVADRLRDEPSIEVLNDVVLNQVLLRFDDDDRTRDVVRRVSSGGTCWVGSTVWRGKVAMRVSVSNWATTSDDIERTAATILRAARIH